MPVTFEILPRRGLVVGRFTGLITVPDTSAATAAYEAHPDFSVGQKQLIDMSGVSGHQIEPVSFMQMQATKADRYTDRRMQALVVYYAPTPEAHALATMYAKSWDPVDAVVALIQPDEARALGLLGQSETSIEALLQTAH
ncbi:MAG: hypothetical protein AAGF60_00340 [Pseudomonadota bacterium]